MIARRSTTTRCMALLCGLHCQESRRISRKDLARSLRRSVKTVFTVLRKLESYGWIEVSGGGNGTAGLITVINDLSWKTADVADVSSKTADDWRKTADVPTHIRAKEVLQGKERHFPSHPVEKTTPETELCLEVDRFAAAHGLPLPSSGADFDRVIAMMQRKPPQAESGLSRAAAGGQS